MAEVIWTDSALTDIEEIAAYIERDSRFYASIMVTEIFTSGNRLDEFPRIGRKVPEFNNPNLRELQAPPYRIIYRLIDAQAHILAIVHSKRNVKKILKKRKIE